MTVGMEPFSTGLPGLDKVLHGLIPGDNVIWQVESIDDYVPFVEAYCRFAARRGAKLVYFRFGGHESLKAAEKEFETCVLDREQGPEAFVYKLHETIERSGRGAWYLFDDLSDLADAWYGDAMLANVFMLTCPYLYEVEAIAYFTMRRHGHSPVATSAILDTAQVVIDVHRYHDRMYVQPIKVDKRHSSTMYMLHEWKGDDFIPVRASDMATQIQTASLDPATAMPPYRLDIWDRTLQQARDVWLAAEKGEAPEDEVKSTLRLLIRMLVARDERVAGLAETSLSLTDVLKISDRLIGTGRIGGKAVGMLVARAILNRAQGPWHGLLEEHDSFYIGSDVFFAYLVRNGVWWAREKQRDPKRFLEDSEQARQRILMGTFPESIQRQFEAMLDYFGQAPIIVRSSSLLEDNFSNAFAGKYESVFCANQGSRETRLYNFLSAVRTIYASSMSERALMYRAQRGILDRDEQMALLVQRVSGTMNGSFFYPHVAGVGFSHNPYVWCDAIDPKAGVLRLVFGLGTRAVDRSDDDFTRLVALNAPERQPEASRDDVFLRTQRRVDVLDLNMNRLTQKDFSEVVAQSPELPLEMFASRDEALLRLAQEGKGKSVFAWRLTFEDLLKQTDFVGEMRRMLMVLEKAYDYPVDVEFTCNFFEDGSHRINLVQCRPLPVKGDGVTAEPPVQIAEADLIFRAHGAVIGQGRVVEVDRIIYVVPSQYGQLPVRDRYSIARLVGTLTRLGGPEAPNTILLMGPGRWGTTTPALGVPVAFGEISRVSVLCEIVAMRDNLVPDVSLGTHFFSELVEGDILYLALFPGHKDNFLNGALLEEFPNALEVLAPSAAKWRDVVRVIDPGLSGRQGAITLNANPLSQDVVCYFDHQET